jgi:DNA-binding transcriptional regulator YiaG
VELAGIRLMMVQSDIEVKSRIDPNNRLKPSLIMLLRRWLVLSQPLFAVVFSQNLDGMML